MAYNSEVRPVQVEVIQPEVSNYDLAPKGDDVVEVIDEVVGGEGQGGEQVVQDGYGSLITEPVIGEEIDQGSGNGVTVYEQTNQENGVDVTPGRLVGSALK